jgi:hypothetical protein
MREHLQSVIQAFQALSAAATQRGVAVPPGQHGHR